MLTRAYFITVYFSFLLKASHSQQGASTDLCSDVVSKLDCSQDPPRKICGTNGVTYPTSCDFAKAHCLDLNLHIKYEGECSDVDRPDPICASLVGISCPASANPVCASDGMTYPSFCEYEQAKCQNPSMNLVNLGACPTASTTLPATTPSIFELVCQLIIANDCPQGQPSACGSNGVVYDSGCELEKANCKANGSITFVQEGQC